jgi:hypothetical protein
MTPKLKTIDWDFKPIAKPGMYAKISLETYHRGDICVGPSVSSSGLRTLFAQSPAHFYASWAGNPRRVERKEKQNFIVGRAAHHLFLGEPFFAKLFVEQPKEYIDVKSGEVKAWSNNANFCREWNRERAKEGRAILKPDDCRAIEGMAESLSKHPLIVGEVKALNGLIERSLFWKDKATGLWLKSRPDSIPTHSGEFVDLKTTISTRWYDLQKTIAEFGYHQQGALLRTAAREVLGLESFAFFLVFIEKEPPYCVRLVEVKTHELDLGEKQNRYAIDAVARCLKSGEWPGPGGDREDALGIELPEWSRKSIESKLQYGVDEA